LPHPPARAPDEARRGVTAADERIPRVPWGAFATETLASPEGEELPVGVASFEQSATVLFEAPLR
jgi:hypothetical protein